MMDLDTLRQDIKRNILYPCGVNIERKQGVGKPHVIFPHDSNGISPGICHQRTHIKFGEKIGGAKKDLWKDRGLYADDLEAMNEREAEKFVKKDNVWKKPDYAVMLEEGIPLGVVYFIKKARDGLNASPQYYRMDDTPEKRTARQKEYIKTVRELQTVLSDVRTVEDAVRA